MARDRDAEGEDEVEDDELEEDEDALAGEEEEEDEEEDDEPDEEVEEPAGDARRVGLGVGIFVCALALGLLFGLAPLRAGDEQRALYLAGAVVLLIGSGFLRIGLEARAAAHAKRRREEGALEPWLRDREWSREGTGPIASERLSSQILGFLFLAGVAFPFHSIWAVPFDWWGFWLVVGILDLLALIGLVVVLRTLWMRSRGGSPRLLWHGVPVAPGATLTARFETTKTLAASGAATLALRCLREKASGVATSGDASPDAVEIGTTTVTAPVRSRPEGGTTVDVTIRVPADARGTNGRLTRPIRWQLEVRIPTPGPDYVATFPIPIYPR